MKSSLSHPLFCRWEERVKERNLVTVEEKEARESGREAEVGESLPWLLDYVSGDLTVRSVNGLRE